MSRCADAGRALAPLHACDVTMAARSNCGPLYPFLPVHRFSYPRSSDKNPSLAKTGDRPFGSSWSAFCSSFRRHSITASRSSRYACACVHGRKRHLEHMPEALQGCIVGPMSRHACLIPHGEMSLWCNAAMHLADALQVLRAHILPLTNCAFNKSGDRFITGSYDRTCKVGWWGPDLTTWQSR
jgi:hypothetical protein